MQLFMQQQRLVRVRFREAIRPVLRDSNRSRGAQPAQPAIRRLELKSTVRSLIVVMVDVFAQYPLEVTLTTNDRPVQTFASSTKRRHS